MTEVLFYHLQNMLLENVLPPLLEKTFERGWRAVVHTTSEERADALDGEHLRHEVRQQHRLIAGTGADLQRAFVARERQELEVARVNGRLRDGLPIADRQRRILIGPMANSRRHEGVARREIERAKHGEIAHSFLPE